MYYHTQLVKPAHACWTDAQSGHNLSATGATSTHLIVYKTVTYQQQALHPPIWSSTKQLPLSNRLYIHPSDNLDSIIPIADLANRLCVEYLRHITADRLAAKATRLVRHQCQHYTLQRWTVIHLVSQLPCYFTRSPVKLDSRIISSLSYCATSPVVQSS